MKVTQWWKLSSDESLNCPRSEKEWWLVTFRLWRCFNSWQIVLKAPPPTPTPPFTCNCFVLHYYLPNDVQWWDQPNPPFAGVGGGWRIYISLHFFCSDPPPWSSRLDSPWLPTTTIGRCSSFDCGRQAQGDWGSWWWLFLQIWGDGSWNCGLMLILYKTIILTQNMTLIQNQYWYFRCCCCCWLCCCYCCCYCWHVHHHHHHHQCPNHHEIAAQFVSTVRQKPQGCPTHPPKPTLVNKT